jgi:hypothetical protein
MTPTWKTVYRFDLPEAPAHLTVTAWGRQFRVAPARQPVRARALTSDVVRVEIFGPTVAPALGPPAPEDVIHVDVVEDLDDDITRVGEPPPELLELAYEVAAEEDAEITSVTPNPTLELRNGNTESRHG